LQAFLGPEIQAIVGFVSQLYFSIIIVANAISIGTVALLSRAVGAGRFEDALTVARQSLLFGIGMRCGTYGCRLLFHNQIISLAGFSTNTRQVAADFFVIFAFALAPNYMVILSTAVFRRVGKCALRSWRCPYQRDQYRTEFSSGLRAVFFQGLGYRGIALSTVNRNVRRHNHMLVLFRKSRWKNIFSGQWHVSLS